MLWPSPPLSMRRLLSLVAPSPLSPSRHHYCRANAYLIAPLSRQRLVVASSPLSLHQCFSCHAGASLIAPPLSCCAAASLLVAPHLRRLVVASPTILTCRRLSCRAGWLSHCNLSLCAAVSLFATSLIAPQALWVIDPLNPSKKRIGLLGGSSSINPMQRHGTKGLMWGASGQFPPAAAIAMGHGGDDVCSWPLVHVSTYLLWNSTYFLQNKNVLRLNYLDSLKFRRHVPPHCLNFRLFRK
jgi:hypothetical protein